MDFTGRRESTKDGLTKNGNGMVLYRKLPESENFWYLRTQFTPSSNLHASGITSKAGPIPTSAQTQWEHGLVVDGTFEPRTYAMTEMVRPGALLPSVPCLVPTLEAAAHLPRFILQTQAQFDEHDQVKCLKRFITTNTFSCVQCKARKPADTLMHGCRLCNHDICESCMAAGPPVCNNCGAARTSAKFCGGCGAAAESPAPGPMDTTASVPEPEPVVVVAAMATMNDAEPSAAVSTEPLTLESFLAANTLTQFMEALVELGCASVDDLKELDEEDVMEIGMKKMEVKRMQRSLAAVPASSFSS